VNKPVTGFVLAAALALAGCSSSPAGTAAGTASPHASAVSRTETLSALVTGRAAAANLNNSSPSAPLTFGSATLSGLVPATIKPFALTGGNGNKGSVTWQTSAGALTVYHVSAPGYDSNSNTPPPATWTLDKATGTCHFTSVFSKGTFTQTGRFGGAHGGPVASAWHGGYTVTAQGYAPLSKGKTACSFTSTGAVQDSGASVRFTASGPVTPLAS
jgi:hypothetical protein